MIRRYFTDRDLGRRFPLALRAAGFDVEAHDDVFAHDVPDEEWLEHVGTNGLVGITHDGRIRYKPNELDAVRVHRVSLIVLVGKVPHAALAENFIRTRIRIESSLDRQAPPFVAKVLCPSPAALKSAPEAQGEILRWYPR